ncbi:MAG: NAD-dependent epimerase/dehydratase [Gemmatimonadetes bacterium]|nr:NAD-dependent epimerase/dehydratase [Gemmatimonadota bacterium]
MSAPARILVTGCNGYIGSVLTTVLQERGYGVVGLDTGYYADCVLGDLGPSYPLIKKDVRDVTRNDLRDVSAVIHLAALSNDPLGELSPGLTEDINLEASIRLATLARAAGVGRFVYASSQSMYGVANTSAELDEDNSEKNPITAYARTKWSAELALKELATGEFTVTCFRPSTVFGASPRLRCDIVFNSLVACAYTTGRIEIKSDGTPWRPVVHVRDVCSAFIAGLEAPAALIGGRSYNVGIANGNFSVRELAEAAGRSVPGSVITYTGEHGSDARTYRVSFARILNELGEWYRPAWTLDRGGAELVDYFRETKFTEADFRGRKTNRLAQLKHLSDGGQIDSQLRWL